MMATFKRIWSFIFFIIPLKIAHAQTCQGCINLDEYSFNKLIPKFKVTLVKYDTAYPYGPIHDAFVEFGNSLIGIKDLIVGDVGIKDYGQRENEDFAKVQEIDPKKLPVIKLYKGSNDVITYKEEDVTVEKLREFVLNHSNIHITLPGCSEQLDKLAMQFVISKDEKILNEIKEYKSENANMKEVYLLYMKKLLDDVDFVQKEHKRLKRILGEGKISEGKKLDLQNKINILYSFQNKGKAVIEQEIDGEKLEL